MVGIDLPDFLRSQTCQIRALVCADTPNQREREREERNSCRVVELKFLAQQPLHQPLPSQNLNVSIYILTYTPPILNSTTKSTITGNGVVSLHQTIRRSFIFRWILSLRISTSVRSPLSFLSDRPIRYSQITSQKARSVSYLIYVLPFFFNHLLVFVIRLL